MAVRLTPFSGVVTGAFVDILGGEERSRFFFTLSLSEELQAVLMVSIVDQLPLEVIEHILDIVAWNDPQVHRFKSGSDIKACSLTCHVFRTRSQQHIFRHVKMYHVDRYTRYPGHYLCPLATKFAELITRRPEIALYVRELHYVLQNMQFGDGDTHIEPVPPALKDMTNLETLALYPESGTFLWRDIRSSSRSLLLQLMHLPSIVSVKLKLIRGFDPAYLGSCVNLKNLHLQSVTLQGTSMSIPIPVKLRELELSLSGPQTVLEMMQMKGPVNQWPALNLGGVTKITVTNTSYLDVKSTAKVLRYINSLEFIHYTALRFLEDVEPIFSSFENSLETLKYLNLDVYVDRPKYDIEPLCGVPLALRSIASINCIESLQIRIQFSRDTNCTVGEDWGVLEEVLLGPGWPSLKQFDLSIFSEGTQKGQWLEQMRLLPYTELAALSSSAFLKFFFFSGERCRIPPNVIDMSMQLSF